MSKRLRILLGAVSASSVLAVTACAAATSGGAPSGSMDRVVPTPSTSSASPSSAVASTASVDREIRVGYTDTTSSRVMAEVYARALREAGYDVALTVPSSIDVFTDAMAQNQVDVVPVSIGPFADYLYTSLLDLGGSRPATFDAPATVAAANQYGADRGIEVLGPSAAAESGTYAVTKEFADLHGISTLSGLAVWSRTNTVRLGADPDCAVRPSCQPLVESTYDMSLKELVPLSSNGAVVKRALDQGSVEVGYFTGTDPILSSPDLVVLEEDIPLNVVGNIAPAVRTAVAEPGVVDTLQSVSASLTPGALGAMVEDVQVGGKDPGRVAGDFIAEKGLGEGLYDGPLRVVGVTLSTAPSEATPTPSTASSPGGPLRISYAPTFDTEVSARILAAALSEAGIDVRVLDPMPADDLLTGLRGGGLDLAPMRLNLVANLLQVSEDGPLSLPITTRFVPDLMSASRDLALPEGLAVLGPTQANAGIAYAVSEQYAERTGVRTLSDLAEASKSDPITLGASPDCPKLSWCFPLLKDGYGVTIDEFVPLDTGGPLSRAAVDSGAVDVALLSANDGGIEQFGLRTLKDDLGRQPANPIAPILSQAAISPDVARVVSRVSDALTTADLKDMNHRVEYEREEMQDVVQEFLDTHDLRGIPLAAAG